MPRQDFCGTCPKCGVVRMWMSSDDAGVRQVWDFSVQVAELGFVHTTMPTESARNLIGRHSDDCEFQEVDRD